MSSLTSIYFHIYEQYIWNFVFGLFFKNRGLSFEASDFGFRDLLDEIFHMVQKIYSKKKIKIAGLISKSHIINITHFFKLGQNVAWFAKQAMQFSSIKTFKCPDVTHFSINLNLQWYIYWRRSQFLGQAQHAESENFVEHFQEIIRCSSV